MLLLLSDANPITATGTGTVHTLTGENDSLALQLVVSAASGTTPTLDVKVEDSLDGVNFDTLATFAQKTTVGNEIVRVTNPFGRVLRVSYTIGGTTPSFTAKVIALAK